MRTWSSSDIVKEAKSLYERKTNQENVSEREALRISHSQLLPWVPGDQHLTSFGYEMQGPKGTQDGDLIVVIGKCEELMILREGHEYLKIVGTCHIPALLSKAPIWKDVKWDIEEMRVRSSLAPTLNVVSMSKFTFRMAPM